MSRGRTNKGLSHYERRKIWLAQDWNLPNSEIARLTGYGYASVAHMRKALGRPNAPLSNKHSIGKVPVEKVLEMHSLRLAGKTLKQIGEAFGINKQRVDQLLNPQKHQARYAVFECLRRGWLVRPQICEGCGAAAEIEAHHDDYSKPLEVKWLCKPCHNLTRVGEARTGMTRSEQDELADRMPAARAA